MSIEGVPAVKAGQKLSGRQVGLYVGVPVAVVAMVFGVSVVVGGDGNPEGSVIQACEDAVEARLKAPSTAGFRSGATETKAGIWSVVGTVDAENGFGAKVRTGFRCTVTWYQPDKSATLAGVTVG